MILHKEWCAHLWELVRNAESQVLPWTHSIKICSLTRLPRGAHTHQCNRRHCSKAHRLFLGEEQIRSSIQGWLIFSPTSTHLLDAVEPFLASLTQCSKVWASLPHAVAICSWLLCLVWACAQSDELTGHLQALSARERLHRYWVLIRGPDHRFGCFTSRFKALQICKLEKNIDLLCEVLGPIRGSYRETVVQCKEKLQTSWKGS